MLVLMIPKITLCLLYVIMLSILLDGTAIADDGRALKIYSHSSQVLTVHPHWGFNHILHCTSAMMN